MVFIHRNYKPKHYYSDLFGRTLDVDGCDLYVAGFPCQAFSMLESETLLMKDRRARPFFAVRDSITELQPTMAVLENVAGLMRVWPSIEKHLQRCGSYLIHLTRLDPQKLGTPIARDRVYIVMIKLSALGGLSADEATRRMDQVVEQLQHSSSISWTALLFPEKHQLVKAERMRCEHREKPTVDRCFCSRCKGFSSKGSDAPLGERPSEKVRCTWRNNHWQHMKDEELEPATVDKYMKAKLEDANVGTLRYKHVLAIQLCKAAKQGRQVGVVDISQAPNRATPRTKDEMMPCITPGGKKYFPKLNRGMLAEEALLFQGYDVEALDFSANTMSEWLP